MSWSYKFIDHTADIAVDIEADKINELFIASAYAFKETITVEKFENSSSDKKIFLEDSSLEILLVSFLSELNYLFQHEGWMMTSVKNVAVDDINGVWKLKAEISGFIFDRSKIKLKSEIKAVTYHQMEIKFHNNKYSTRIVFDI